MMTLDMSIYYRLKRLKIKGQKKLYPNLITGCKDTLFSIASRNRKKCNFARLFFLTFVVMKYDCKQRILYVLCVVALLCSGMDSVSAQKDNAPKKTPFFKTLPSASFLTINAEYLGGYRPDQTFSAQVPAFGFKAGTMRNVGWYVGAMTNFNFKGAFVVCDESELNPLSTSSSYFDVLAGITLRYWAPLSFHLGLGYSYRSFNNETIYGQWAHTASHISQGPAAAAGFMFHLGGFVVSGEVLGLYNVQGLQRPFYQVDKNRFSFGVKAGLGICIPYRYRTEFQERERRGTRAPEPIVTETPVVAPTVSQPQTPAPVAVVAQPVVAARPQPAAPTARETATLEVVTMPVSQVMPGSVTVCGQVTGSAAEEVVERGVCWSNTPYPSVTGAHTSDGEGDGYFTTVITGLNPGTVCYIRAYAGTKSGIRYGNTVSVTIPVQPINQPAAPQVQPYQQPAPYPQTTFAPAPVTAPAPSAPVQPAAPQSVAPQPVAPQPSAPQTVTPQSVAPQPVVSQPTASQPAAPQAVAPQPAAPQPTASQPVVPQPVVPQPVAQQTVEPTAAVVAAVVPAAVVPDCPSTMSDVEGNVYHTIRIGGQCWMRENLRATRFADGGLIALSDSALLDSPCLYYPAGDSANASVYGCLYNWSAASNKSTLLDALNGTLQGACPDGWHLPSDAEWSQLVGYLSQQPICVCGTGHDNIAKSLASQTGWNTVQLSGADCAVGKELERNNVSGFTAMPAGVFYQTPANFGNSAGFWTSTPGSKGLTVRLLFSESAQLTAYGDEPGMNGYSVRCLKN